MRQILVLRGGALGDLIVTLPALALLRQRWPDARIELVGNATAAQLARTRGLIDAVHSQHEARWSNLFGDAALSSELAAWLRGFDLILSYWPDPDGAIRRHLPLRTEQVFLSAGPMPLRAPAAAHYCDPLRALGIEARGYFFPLAPAGLRTSGGTTPSLTQRATTFVHPGSGSPRKNWPAENWLQLIAQLPAPVALILGEAELPRWSELSSTRFQEPGILLKQRLGDKPLHLINLPLEDLVTHFSHCRLFLGHDSGISHLAAACGAKCVLLFGPTEPARWAPPAPNVRVIRRGSDLASISIADVQQAVAAALADQT